MSHFPKQGFRLALDFRNETGAMQGDSRHDRRPAGKQRPHRGDKPLREALHLADLIHNVDSGAWVWRKQCRSFIDCGHVHTILPDAVALREGGMRDNTLLPLKAQQPKSASLSTLPDLLRIEASQLSQLELRDNAPDHRRFADPQASL